MTLDILNYRTKLVRWPKSRSKGHPLKWKTENTNYGFHSDAANRRGTGGAIIKVLVLNQEEHHYYLEGILEKSGGEQAVAIL